MRRIVLSLSMLLAAVVPVAAQAPAPTAAKEPPFRRYLEFQQFVISTRYRFIRNSADVTTSNHEQYREQIRVRFNVDKKKRIGIVTGVYSGSQFIASWNNLGPGTGTFDGHNHYMRQLYASVTPAPGVEGQVGGIYVNRGETTEYTSYDDDGYIVGGRFSLKRPKQAYFY